MIPKKDYGRVRGFLQQALERRFSDVSVAIGDDLHYPGTNVVVTSEAFKGLLAEQRFHHVVRAIPSEVYDEFLRTGVVWFELAPGETGRDLMKMPRSSDIAPRQEAIRKKLDAIGFVDRFTAALGPEPGRASDVRFDAVRQVLGDAKYTEAEATDACLYMILLGAYCDAHVMKEVLPKLKAAS